MIHSPEIKIGRRLVGPNHPPLVIPEIGINHEGRVDLAKLMIDAAAKSGAELVKFQCHVVKDEMVPAAKQVVPGNASESIYAIMERCALSLTEDQDLKRYAEDRNLLYLSTPFSRAAADQLEQMEVLAYKIGSGECNNYPLLEHIASFGKPIILSTGMNDLHSIERSASIFRRANVPYALTHCTSMYPTPYSKVRLGALAQLGRCFPDAVLGLSDHSLGIYTCLGAVALGASILEKHFTHDRSLPGPDIPISIDPSELDQLIKGSQAIWEARGGSKSILPEEQPTIDFAYACVVTIAPINKGQLLTRDNVWVKRPGTGQIKAVDFESVLGRPATADLPADHQVAWSDLI